MHNAAQPKPANDTSSRGGSVLRSEIIRLLLFYRVFKKSDLFKLNLIVSNYIRSIENAYFPGIYGCCCLFSGLNCTVEFD